MIGRVGRPQGVLLGGAVLLIVLSLLPWWTDTFASPSWASAWAASTVWIICIAVVAGSAVVSALVTSIRTRVVLAAGSVLAALWSVAYLVRLHGHESQAWWTLGAGTPRTQPQTVAVALFTAPPHSQRVIQRDALASYGPSQHLAAAASIGTIVMAALALGVVLSAVRDLRRRAALAG